MMKLFSSFAVLSLYLSSSLDLLAQHVKDDPVLPTSGDVAFEYSNAGGSLSLLLPEMQMVSEEVEVLENLMNQEGPVNNGGMDISGTEDGSSANRSRFAELRKLPQQQSLKEEPGHLGDSSVEQVASSSRTTSISSDSSLSQVVTEEPHKVSDVTAEAEGLVQQDTLRNQIASGQEDVTRLEAQYKEKLTTGQYSKKDPQSQKTSLYISRAQRHYQSAMLSLEHEGGMRTAKYHYDAAEYARHMIPLLLNGGEEQIIQQVNNAYLLASQAVRKSETVDREDVSNKSRLLPRLAGEGEEKRERQYYLLDADYHARAARACYEGNNESASYLKKASDLSSEAIDLRSKQCGSPTCDGRKFIINQEAKGLYQQAKDFYIRAAAEYAVGHDQEGAQLSQLGALYAQAAHDNQEAFSVNAKLKYNYATKATRDRNIKQTNRNKEKAAASLKAAQSFQQELEALLRNDQN